VGRRPGRPYTRRTAMDGGIGQCKNQACGQTDALTYDGFCSDTCRMEATGCSVPECGCGGVCDGVSRCTSCDRYTLERRRRSLP
jgi:hypothetical protein